MSVTKSKSKSSSQAFSMKKRQTKNIKPKSNHVTKKIKRKKRRRPKRKNKKILKELYITFGIFFILLITVLKITITLPKIEGYSMIPTLEDGNRVVVNKFEKIKRFKLVYFKDKMGNVGAVRRIIGLPGDRIKYVNDQLWINEQDVYERFLEKSLHKIHDSEMTFTEDFTLEQVTGEEVIPSEKYFVLGDNRSFSSDSREYGLIDKSQIIGTIDFRLFPLHKF